MGIKHQTIQKRLDGVKPQHQAHRGQQKMPPEIENILIEWIKAEDLSGNALSFARTHIIAEDML